MECTQSQSMAARKVAPPAPRIRGPLLNLEIVCLRILRGKKKVQAHLNRDLALCSNLQD